MLESAAGELLQNVADLWGGGPTFTAVCCTLFAHSSALAVDSNSLKVGKSSSCVFDTWCWLVGLM
jgi:hypothetical protein